MLGTIANEPWEDGGVRRLLIQSIETMVYPMQVSGDERTQVAFVLASRLALLNE